VQSPFGWHVFELEAEQITAYEDVVGGLRAELLRGAATAHEVHRLRESLFRDYGVQSLR
jgi:hypothetical protein